MSTHPEAGPVVSQNVQTGQLVVTIAVDASGITEAVEKGVPIFVAGLDASNLTPSGVLDISVSSIPADELDEAGQLQPA